jgi:hypothetical protein
MGMFGMKSFNEMMACGETFEEYHSSGRHFIMERQTMIMFKRKLYDLMDTAGLAL